MATPENPQSPEESVLVSVAPDPVPEVVRWTEQTESEGRNGRLMVSNKAFPKLADTGGYALVKQSPSGRTLS